MDGIHLADRKTVFPDEAKTTLYTAHYLVYHKDNIRPRQNLRLSEMEIKVRYSGISPKLGMVFGHTYSTLVIKAKKRIRKLSSSCG